ncbi:hypothetical protein AB0C52_27805 [Streptomyces sp. NPDC048717]|uniref:hypothetical protein n=1 Tax=unclassified Streptomyces TaxID=2593676 RepID=UPI003416FBEE
MNNRQRSHRLSRLRKSPGFPPSRRRQTNDSVGQTPTAIRQPETSETPSSDSA